VGKERTLVLSFASRDAESLGVFARYSFTQSALREGPLVYPPWRATRHFKVTSRASGQDASPEGSNATEGSLLGPLNMHKVTT